MCPEAWQSVQSVVLLYWGNVEFLAQLCLAIQVLRRALPAVSIALIIPYSAEQINHLLESIDIISLQNQIMADRSSDQCKNQLNTVDFHNQNSIGQALLDTLMHQKFDAAIVFTDPGQSPFSLAYLCYLAGIPIRLGQSQEFGGSVLSACISPPAVPISLAKYHLHLLYQAGLSIAADMKEVELAIA